MSLVVLDDCHVVLNVREDYMPYFRMNENFMGPFIQQVMSDAEQIAAAETEQPSEVSISDEEYDAVRRPTPQRTSYDPAAPVYAVGDTV